MNSVWANKVSESDTEKRIERIERERIEIDDEIPSRSSLVSRGTDYRLWININVYL